MGNTFRLTVLLVVSLALVGCIPDAIVWLPDSSGFIYTTGDDVSAIRHYGLGTLPERSMQ